MYCKSCRSINVEWTPTVSRTWTAPSTSIQSEYVIIFEIRGRVMTIFICLGIMTKMAAGNVSTVTPRS